MKSAQETALKLRVVKAEHPLNASLPTEATELGMVILVRHLQSMNAHSLMLVTELGIVIFVKLLQS